MINIHYSLLPKYRGASPIESSIRHGDKITGVSLIDVAPKIDSGDIISATEVQINEDDDGNSLREKLNREAIQLVCNTLPKYFYGLIKSVPQDETQATYCTKISKGEAEIDWQLDVEEIIKLIHALARWPKAYTVVSGKRIIFHKAKVVNGKITPILIQTEGKVAQPYKIWSEANVNLLTQLLKTDKINKA